MSKSRGRHDRWRGKAPEWREAVDDWKAKSGISSDRALVKERFAELGINPAVLSRVLQGRESPPPKVQELFKAIRPDLWDEHKRVLDEQRFVPDSSSDDDFAESLWQELQDAGHPGEFYVVAGLPIEHQSEALLRRTFAYLDEHTENRFIFLYQDPEEEVLAAASKLEEDQRRVLELWRRIDRRSIREFLDALVSRLQSAEATNALERIEFLRFRTGLPHDVAQDKASLSYLLLSMQIFNPFTLFNLFIGQRGEPVGYLFARTADDVYRWMRLSKINARALAAFVRFLCNSELCVKETIRPTLFPATGPADVQQDDQYHDEENSR